MTSGIQERITDWTGRTVYDPDGERIGTIEHVWLDESSGRPEWLTVKTGLFGMRESFLPVQGLRGASGTDLQTPYAKEQVKDAPSLDPEGDHLDQSEEERLYSHYGITGAATDRRNTSRDTTRGDTDEAMTRSEEHLRVGTERREAGHARLRKHVTTETERAEVPVTRERVRVEREPITDANRGDALSGPEFTESEHEVTLHEERPVVDTETTPVERVRLAKEQVTDTETVTGRVRKEHIETEGDLDRDRRDRR